MSMANIRQAFVAHYIVGESIVTHIPTYREMKINVL